MTINLSTIKTWYVAYSGGLDSTVLLHRLWQQNLPIHAIHINHQLQSQANTWAKHCEQQCQQWNIPIIIKTVNAQKNNGESPEAAARSARYAAFNEIIQENTLLCLAHHQDDQAETLLLQLLRGAGVAGLAAMPEQTPFGASYLLRPLLKMTRQELQQYATEHQLKWINDPSNEDDKFDRNYLRKHIMPLLKHRWPAATQTLSRSAEHCAEAAQLIQTLAEQDYLQVKKNNELSINQLSLLSPERQRQVIRYWLTQQQLPLPSTTQLQQIQEELLTSKEDAQPLVHWPRVNIQRYKDQLFANKSQAEIDLTNEQLPWDLKQPLKLPANLGNLSTQLTQGKGISAQRLAKKTITIQFRKGGERCHPSGRAHSQTLKNLFQEYNIPAWQRDQIPLLYCNNEIAAAVGHWICIDYQAKPEEMGWIITQHSE